MQENELIIREADNENTYIEMPADQVLVSVRRLVEFVLRHGDIDNRYHGSTENAMQEGSRIHRMIQRRMGGDYQAEVSLKITIPNEKYTLIVGGRADGVIENADGVMVDEIKGTYRDVNYLKEPVLEHVAQARCYAYILCVQKELQEIQIRMTYCNMETEEIRYFYEKHTAEALKEWFENLIAEYRKWADYTWSWRKIRQASIEQLQFPFPYREGQRELASYVYQTIYHKKKLFLEAPTGVGKTISTIFPAIKAIGKNMGDRFFYLTAKTITASVADDTLKLLRGKGLHFKSVVLTAKEKICFQEKCDCNPDACPYAKGHYDRINAAIYELLTKEEQFNREKIEEYAMKYQVCPFEFCLDMSLFADAVIGDYNYLFDPHVYLKRFFADGSDRNYLFLIDEAHNLLERGREMYSARLVQEDFIRLKRQIQETIMSEMEKNAAKKQVSGQLTLQMTEMSNETSVEEPDRKGKRFRGKSILLRQGYGEKMKQRLDKCIQEFRSLRKETGENCLADDIDGVVNAVMRLYNTFSDYLEEQEEGKLEVRENILELYFTLSHFLDIYERTDKHYVKYTQVEEDGSFVLKLFCVNPCENLKECMARGRSSILFSATFLPIQYYKELLGGDAGDYEVYAKSVFNPEKRALFIAGDVTSKYSRRTMEEYVKMACYIDEIVKNRHGNYMVFCPSYQTMRQIYEIYSGEFAGADVECLTQQEAMREEEREAFLNRFRSGTVSETGEERILVGFCVLGGIFGEGIDLKKDSLIGAIIIGTGIPQVCFERELLKNYFDENGENGFDYAYRYPGMNKVLQAAGRVIRTAEDIGVIALLDERFLQMSSRKLFPREWDNFEIVQLETVSKRVERFWDSWL